MKNGFLYIICLFQCVVLGCKQNSSDEIKAISSNDIMEFIENPMQSDGTIDTTKIARMDFEYTTFDFGTVEEGDQLVHRFTFENTGMRPLLISNATSTCGCTVPDWPKTAIGVGEKGEIDVKFNTTGRLGQQTKPVRINANTWPNETIIYIKAIVQSKQE